MSPAAWITMLIRDAVPYSYVLLALAAVGLLLGVVALRQQLGQSARAARMATALTAACLVAILATGAIGMAHGRRLLERSVLGPADSGVKAWSLMRGVAMQIDIAAVASLAALVLVLLLAAAVIAGALQMAADKQRPSTALLLGILLPLGLALLAAFQYELYLLRGLLLVMKARPADKVGLFLLTLREAQEVLDRARPFILGAAAAGGLVALLTSREEEPLPSAASYAAGALLFTGGLAFALTRPLAADARHPLSEFGDSTSMMLEGTPNVPQVSTCAEAEQVPVIAFDQDRVRVNGTSVRTPQELAENLSTYRKNYQLLHPESAPSPLLAGIAAAPESKLAAMRDWLWQAPSTGQPAKAHWLLLAKRSRREVTQTLGTFTRTQACGFKFTVQVQADAQGSTAPATWGELAELLQRAQHEVTISP